MRKFRACIAFAASLFLVYGSAVSAEKRPPNIVYIMSDELAYFEIGHMGNPYLKTPRIDAMAKEGLRFTNALAAAPVCGPLRGSLMTGKHQGHCSVRANDGGTALQASDITIAETLKQKNYATGGYGKWGAGGRGSTGVPEKHGFDDFFGYYDQVHAHSFYPPYIVRNSEEVPLKGNAGGREGETYSHYEIMKAGLDFIRQNKDKPFFAYFPITPPHGMYDIPADDPAWKLYENEAWMKDPKLSQDVKNYAAMVSMIDRDLGDIIDLLKAEGLEENTIVFFTGDNGGQDRFKSKDHPRGFYMPNKDPKSDVEFRGGKGNLYEGGLKIPFLVRWPGKIEPGRVSDLIFNQVDIFPTLADVTGTKAPEDLDGISILPEILGDSENQKQHEMLYWEYSSQTAVRMGKWKGIQPNKFKQPDLWELYDLDADISETNNIAADHSGIIEKFKTYAAAEHQPWVKGTYSDPKRTLHERDRQAKFGTTRRPPAPKQKGKVHKIIDKNLIPAEEMSLVSFSSESRGNDRLAEYAIDGKPNTVWHSQFNPEKKTHPHELVIDLGKKRTISGFRYLARQDGGWNGAFAKTEFFISDNPKESGDSPNIAITFEKTATPQAADLEEPIAGRYVRVRINSEVNGAIWASAAEIGILEAKGEKGPKGNRGGPVESFNLVQLDFWNGNIGDWAMAKTITGSKTEKKWEEVIDGEGIFYNGKKGKTSNVISTAKFGDVEAVIEFMIPAKSNSGIYFQDRYELQILDSFGKAADKFSVHDCGSIYERWDNAKPKGQNGFEGTVASSNECKTPGEWQKFEVTFRAPRFDSAGKKTENARFVSVKLNGVQIHKNVEVTGPTRGGKAGAETTEAPIRIQGDHGPVAFRKLEFTPISLD